MSSVNVRSISLNQTTVLGSKKTEVVLTQLAERYRRDPVTREATTELEGYNVTVQSPRTGEPQTVKLPRDCESVINEIREALAADKVVTVTFNGTFVGKFWAMYTDGRVKQGVSATATSIAIVSVKDRDDEFDELELD
ncbi:MAG: hypothetical protein K5678_05180 [Acetatifactor sp.]|nr:hypothetical protein [Acetatifactor sp.]